MIRGRVHEGVIVLEHGASLPEGQVVVVLPRGSGHSVLDIPTVHVGAVLCPLTSDDDLLEEMLAR